jgi:hypothetical protein
VFVSFSASSTNAVNVAEFSGIYYADPLDSWGQNSGVSTVSQPNTSSQVIPARATDDLFLFVANSTNAITAAQPSYTALANAGDTSFSPIFYVPSASSQQVSWSMAAGGSVSMVGVSFQAGAKGLNPGLQFPETLVQIAPTNNWQLPIKGNAVWTNISQYVLNMDIGPFGRQHELDRVQPTIAHLRVDNRNGVFNRWNTGSFLYNSGAGLLPMSPIKITTAWNGITYPKFMGYMQGIVPAINDVVDVNADITAYDILQHLSLKYLDTNVYANQVLSYGASVTAYYKLNDPTGSTVVADSGPNNYTGSLFTGENGNPAFEVDDPFLFTAGSALDLTNGTNAYSGNGYVRTNNYTVQPPDFNQPLQSASVFTVDGWFRLTGASVTPTTTIQVQANSAAVASPVNGVGMIYGVNAAPLNTISVGDYVWGPGIPGSTANSGGAYAVQVSAAVGQVYIGLSTAAVNGGLSTYFSTNQNTTSGDTPTLWQVNSGGSVGTVGAFFNVFPNSITMRSTGYPYLNCYYPKAYDGNWHYYNMTYGAGSVQAVIDNKVFGPASTATDFYPGGTAASANGSWGNGTALHFGPFPGYLSNVATYNVSQFDSPFYSANYSYGKWMATVEVGAAQGGPSAGRLNKALALMGLDPTIILTVPYPFLTTLYAETNSVATTSGMNYMQTIAETEPGLIFQDPNGLIYAYNRQYQYFASTSTTSQATIADAASVSVHYQGTSIKISGDDLDIWNDVQAQSSRSGSFLQIWGPEQSTAASTSTQSYGPRTLQGLTSLMQQNDADVLAMAQNYLNWYVNPLIRITDITLQSQSSNGYNIPLMLGLGLLNRVTVQYYGQSTASPLNQPSLIESINDHVDMTGPTWSTTWSLSPFEIQLTPTIFGTFKFGATSGQTGFGQLTL